MKVYERKAGSPFKWIFAGILFVLAMSFTMTDVYGFNYPYQSGQKPALTLPADQHHTSSSTDGTNSVPPSDNPCAVPEPTTLLLVAGGLGLAALRKNRQLES
jgi:hypothetical protein